MDQILEFPRFFGQNFAENNRNGKTLDVLSQFPTIWIKYKRSLTNFCLKNQQYTFKGGSELLIFNFFLNFRFGGGRGLMRLGGEFPRPLVSSSGVASFHVY